ncbi:MAG: nascent polypeptide-associated complex protein [DPANN group archaeon]|nr:nascent polypeptide-associated complex protein [DPANN group archaeon]
MIPGLNPRKAAQMMKKMGIQQEEVSAEEVIIRTAEKEIVIHQPSVQKINMMGQKSYQISGEEEERSLSTEAEITEEDITTVVKQTGKSEEEALAAIKRHDGDLAAAIMELSDK